MSESIIQNVVSQSKNIAENRISETILSEIETTGINPVCHNQDNEFVFSVGMHLQIRNDHYRVIHIASGSVVLCKMYVNFLETCTVSTLFLQSEILNGDAEMIQESEEVFDKDCLKDEYRSDFEYRKDVISRLVNEYGPEFIELQEKTPKNLMDEIINENKLKRRTIQRILIRYIQSGFCESALADQRWLRQGRTENNNKNSQINNKFSKYFDWAIEYYKTHKGKASFQKAFLMMRYEFFSEEVVAEDGSTWIQLRNDDEVPTYRQFDYYLHKKLSKKSIDIIKTNAREYRNNRRLLTGSSETGVYGAYDVAEMDASEIDVALVDKKGHTVGRPIVYLIVDVASRAIIGASVSFENNSLVGLINCFASMGVDKKELLMSHGITQFDSKSWLTGYMPRAIRVDNGSDFRSNQLSSILQSFGIQRILVTPAMGSYKAIVERAFEDFESHIRSSFVGHGLITKEHNSKHNKQATITFEEFEEIFYEWVIVHNTSLNKGILLSQDMSEKKIPRTPADVMDYYLQAKKPISLPQGDDFLVRLLPKGKASLSKKGLVFNHLLYSVASDLSLSEKMISMGNEIDNSFTILYDPRCIDTIYYIQDNGLKRAQLNTMYKTQRTFLGMTMDQVTNMFESNKKQQQNTQQQTDNIKAAFYAKTDKIVQDADIKKNADTKNIRKNRSAEKQRINSNQSLEKSLNTALTDSEAQLPDISAAKQLPKPEENPLTNNIDTKRNQTDSVLTREKMSETKKIEKKKKLTREEKLKKIGDLADGFIKE